MGGEPTVLLSKSAMALPTHQRHAEHSDQKHRDARRFRYRKGRDIRLPIDSQFAVVGQIVAERLAHRELADIGMSQIGGQGAVRERTGAPDRGVAEGGNLIARCSGSTIRRIIVPGIGDHRAGGIEPRPAGRHRKQIGGAAKVFAIQHGADGGCRSALVLRRRFAGRQDIGQTENAFGKLAREHDTFDGLRRKRNLIRAAVREGRGVSAESIGHSDRKRHWRGMGTGGTHEQCSNSASNDSQSSQIVTHTILLAITNR